MRRGRGSGEDRERGATLVELALVAPMLALLAVGVVDIGRAYRVKTHLANAAWEGARYAQFFPSRADNSEAVCADPGNVAFVARNEGSTPTSFTVAVSNAANGTAITGCDRTSVAPGTKVVVTTSTPFDVLTPVAAVIVGDRLTLRTSVEVVVQG
jgi:Flp pilus assembly protein TadG